MSETELINNLSELVIETSHPVFSDILESVMNKDENGLRLIKVIKDSDIDSKEKLFKMIAKILAKEIYEKRKELQMMAALN